MAIVGNLITQETDGTISFGNFELPKKEKNIGYEIGGNLYDIRTFKEITKLNKDEALLYESIPGTVVKNFKMTDKEVTFLVSGIAESQITMELSPETKYNLLIDDVHVGRIESSVAGKINFSVDCDKAPTKVKIKKL